MTKFLIIAEEAIDNRVWKTTKIKTFSKIIEAKNEADAASIFLKEVEPEYKGGLICCDLDEAVRNPMIRERLELDSCKHPIEYLARQIFLEEVSKKEAIIASIKTTTVEEVT